MVNGAGVAPLRAAGLERAALLPDAGHAAFDIGGLVVFLDHGNAIGVLEGACEQIRRRSAQGKRIKTTS